MREATANPQQPAQLRFLLYLTIAFALALASMTIVSPTAAAAGSIVGVGTVAELEAAASSGAARIMVAPGDYLVDATITLEDVELIGDGNGVTFAATDPNLAAMTLTPLFSVAGRVLVENVTFVGGGFSYVGSAPAADSQPHNRITIRHTRFETGLFDPFDPEFVDPPEPRWFISAVLLGNFFAGPGAPAVGWDIQFADNYVYGGFTGLVVGDFLSDSTRGRVKAVVERNEFHGNLDPGLVVLGSFVGANATVTGISRDNVYRGLDNPFGFGASGLAVNAGISSFNDPGSDGGSFATATWTSKDERFVASGGIFVTGGRRYLIEDGVSEGNEVRINILSPVFEDSVLRDITIAASSNNFPDEVLGDFPANGDGVGNTVLVTLRGADFSGDPGSVWIMNHAGTELDNPVPPMPTEPSYGNRAVLLGSRQALEASNPGINEIPDGYFTRRANS